MHQVGKVLTRIFYVRMIIVNQLTVIDLKYPWLRKLATCGEIVYIYNDQKDKVLE